VFQDGLRRFSRCSLCQWKRDVDSELDTMLMIGRLSMVLGRWAIRSRKNVCMVFGCVLWNMFQDEREDIGHENACPVLYAAICLSGVLLGT